MVFPSTIEAEGLTYYDAKKPPFSLFGVYLDEKGFTRLPEEVAKNPKSYTGMFLKKILK